MKTHIKCYGFVDRPFNNKRDKYFANNRLSTLRDVSIPVFRNVGWRNGEVHWTRHRISTFWNRHQSTIHCKIVKNTHMINDCQFWI